MQRRLSVILAADVVGYSRLMEVDEADTYERLTACRVGIFEPEIARHGGRLFKLMGDGVLVEFDSIVQAVECAIAIQCGMASRNRSLPADQRIDVRMGINLGEVIVEGDDLLGEGVNIAARVQQLAEPGGICVSAKVAQEVDRKLNFSFEPLGEHRVKNIAAPISVYAVKIDGLASGPPARSPPLFWWKRAALALAAIALVAAVAGGWWLWTWHNAAPLHDKPSIAVLPFDNIGKDDRWTRFADGLTEDIITDLAHSKELLVIARNSTAAYRGKAGDLRKVGKELGVQYVLEGSIQPTGDKIRVTAQLVNAANGDHVWSARYDRRAEDLFAVQNEVTQRIATTLIGTHGAIANAARTVARRKPPNSLSAFDLYLLGMEAKHKMTLGGFDEAERYFLAALSHDPEFARAYVGLSYTYTQMRDMGLFDRISKDELLAKRLTAAKKAVELDPDDADAHLALGIAYDTLTNNHGPMVAEFSRAEALAPNSADVLAVVGWNLSNFDSSNHPAELVERAIKLNPNYPYWYNYALRDVYFLSGDFEKALKYGLLIGELAAADHAILAISYAQLGEHEQAERQVAAVRSADPSWSAEKHLSDLGYFGDAQAAFYFEAARKAGLPTCVPAEKLEVMPQLARLKSCDEERAKP